MAASSPGPLDLFTVTAPGLEALAVRELHALGRTAHVAGTGGVAWRGSPRALYDANLRSRIASRILVRVDRFHASSFHELERRAKRVPWSRFVTGHDVVRFRVTCHKSALYHSDAVAQRLAESVIRATGAQALDAEPSDEDDDPQSENGGTRPEQLFVVRLDHDTLTLSADSSGALLHRRGYRLATAKAPLRETIAAAMLVASGWDAATPLVDPMCGSGTIGIEAALLARRIAPGRERGFRFQAWPEADAAEWASVVSAAHDEELPSAPAPIIVSDRDAGAIEATIANAERAGVAEDVTAVQRPLSALGTPSEAGWIITNPPYGIRVGADVRNLYSKLGALVRNAPAGWRLGMLSASVALDRQLQLPLEQVFDTRNGGIRVRFVRSAHAKGSDHEG
jgi:putative N6-adenine-specific DNA methylase